MMRKVEVRDKVAELGAELPPVETFWKVGDLTALRRDDRGHYYRSNYERGLLLYALVTTYRPRLVLEFGTGRGYGALCMARAMHEHDIDGQVVTIDAVAYHEQQEWPIDWGNGPLVEKLACSDVWPKMFPDGWLKLIRCLNASSSDAMARWPSDLGSVDFVYIDGGHDHETVRHDFYSSLVAVGATFRMLFDDYSDNPKLGIQRLVDDEISSVFRPELIWADRRPPGSHHDTEPKPTSEMGMVLIDSEDATVPWREAFPPRYLAKELKRSRARMRWARRRAAAKTFVPPTARRLLKRLLKR